MNSIVRPRSDSKASALDTPVADEPTHAVCDCMMEATPRLALCGFDCTDAIDDWSGTPCVVCADLIHAPCNHCGWGH